MNLKEQLYVCTLAKTKSIARAAEELFISQPALSVYITNLEKYLGIALFERTGRRFVLTYAGELYVRKAEAMLQMKAEFDHDAEQIRNQFMGRVRIGLQLRRGPVLIPRALARFAAEYPQVEVVIKEGIHAELEEMLDHRELDILLAMGEMDRKDLDYQLIYQEQVLLALPGDHPACALAEPAEGSRFKRIPLRLVKDETFILQKQEQSIRKTAERIMQSEQIRPGRVMLISNMEVAMQLVAEGLGVGFNREGYVSGMNYGKPVRYFSVGEKPFTTPFVMAFPKDTVAPAYVERMKILLKEEAENIRSEYR